MDIFQSRQASQQTEHIVHFENKGTKQEHNRRYLNNRVKTAKYTWWNFFPLNLINQFKKAPNVYFLVIAILQTIELISISNGNSAMAFPLVFVILVSMIKDAYEDYRRHVNDRGENMAEVQVFSSTSLSWETKYWADVWCGDVVKVADDQDIPADLLILNTSEEKGIAFVETKNLDGETNLKLKTTHKELIVQYPYDDLAGSKISNLNFKGSVEVAPPNNDIYKFDGKWLTSNGSVESLISDNFVLKGSKLRNTQALYGLVIYTGHHTKVMMNSSKPRFKISDLERLTNKSILIILVTQFILAGIAAITGTVAASQRDDNIKWLLQGIKGQEDMSKTLLFIQLFGSWVLMLTNFVPISLIVTLELVKFWQGSFMSMDYLMFNQETMEGMRCQSSNLNEQLGQVEYVFSDKTGTLTCNIMEFRRFTAGMEAYGTDMDGGPNQQSNVNFKDDKMFEVLYNPSHSDHEALREVVLQLAVCHTVIIDDKKNQYSAASPDELALVYAAKQFGFEFKGKDQDDNLIVHEYQEPYQENGENKLKMKWKYKLLNTLEFNSTRKRMSVIVQDPQGRIVLMSKGADSIIAQRLTQQSKDSKEFKQTQVEVDKYANEGLRTLFLSHRYLDQETYDAWNAKAYEANRLIQGREEALEKINEEIEWEMTITGSTAIEDRLQSKVAEVIQSLKAAGIKVWVLTGDKVGTAINIGHSAGLLDSSMDQHKITDSNENQIREKIDKTILKIKQNNTGQKQALIIGGATLTILYANKSLQEQFVKLTDRCDVVLACRVSPKQKADIVNLIKDNYPDKITLSIGDGANDVNMIQQAHVGVGLMGLEGSQAARAADFSIGQFRYLQPLMFIHGREAYRRNSLLVLYTFYKNILYICTQYVLGFWSVFSAQVLYEPFIYQLYNIMFTSIPIMYYALFDFEYDKFNTEIDDQKRELSANKKFLMNNPELYRIGINYSCYSLTLFTKWLLYGIAQSLIIFWLTYYLICTNDLQSDGKNISFWVIGHTVYGACIFVANIVIFFRFNNYTGWGEWTCAAMILGFFLAFYVESMLPMFSQTYYIFDTMMLQDICWVQMLVSCMLAALVEFGYKVWIVRNDGRYWRK